MTEKKSGNPSVLQRFVSTILRGIQLPYDRRSLVRASTIFGFKIGGFSGIFASVPSFVLLGIFCIVLWKMFYYLRGWGIWLIVLFLWIANFAVIYHNRRKIHWNRFMMIAKATRSQLAQAEQERVEREARAGAGTLVFRREARVVSVDVPSGVFSVEMQRSSGGSVILPMSIQTVDSEQRSKILKGCLVMVEEKAMNDREGKEVRVRSVALFDPSAGDFVPVGEDAPKTGD